MKKILIAGESGQFNYYLTKFLLKKNIKYLSQIELLIVKKFYFLKKVLKKM
jgi:hypothetical protein